jgi:hypothetical protein
MEEIAGPILAKLECPEKERRIQFQNSWNRVNNRFYFA